MNDARRGVRAGLGLFLCLVLLAGCGSGPEGNEYVEYNGTTLIVEGKPYEREATLDPPGTYLPGRIVIEPEQGKHAAAVALIERYGLTLEGSSAEGWLLAKGPDGFEWQWAVAIQHELGGLSFATIDSATSPTPIAAETKVSAGAPMPDREPSAEEVRRAFVELYDQLEKAGGLPVTITATGRSTVFRAELYDARKKSCRALPQAIPNDWECTAELSMSLCSGDCEPSFQDRSTKDERISLRWNPAQGRYTAGD
ncbi:MAG: hypothetical protein QM769_04625 [Pseudoxanthomonas sp.]